MKCPYCGDEMELGSIESTMTTRRGGLEWLPENREKGFQELVNILKGKSKSVSLSFFGGVKAYRCEKCKKIIIDESAIELFEE